MWNKKNLEGIFITLNKNTRILWCFITVMVLSLLLSGCSNEKKGLNYVENHINNFDIKSEPYKDNIEFTLTTDKLLKGIKEPIKLKTFGNTDVYLTKIEVRKIRDYDTNQTVIIHVGFESHYISPQGTMLCMERYNDDNTVTTGLTQAGAYSDTVRLNSMGSYAGDNTGYDSNIYEQEVGFKIKKHDILKSKKWHFRISGLYLLEYSKK